jgi:hypothetical protein
MAKAKTTGNSVKLLLNKRKKGKAQKAKNKHDNKSKVYRGQGK